MPCGRGGGGVAVQDMSFSLEELRTQFKKHTVVSALQCAGNRQEDFVTPDRPLYVAPHWRNGAIGCAKWAGVKASARAGGRGAHTFRGVTRLGSVTKPRP